MDVSDSRSRALTPATKLDDSLDEVAKEEREAEATLVEKRASMDAYDRAFSLTANLAGTLLELAEETELARRVRPSQQRPGQTAADARGEPEPAPPVPPPEPIPE